MIDKLSKFPFPPSCDHNFLKFNTEVFSMKHSLLTLLEPARSFLYIPLHYIVRGKCVSVLKPYCNSSTALITCVCVCTHVCSNRSRASVLTRSCRKFRSWEGFSWGALCRSVWLCASVSMYVCLYVFVLDLLISSRCVGLRASTITPSHWAPFAYSWGKNWSDFSHMADINIFAVHPTDIHMNGNMRSKSAKGFLRAVPRLRHQRASKGCGTAAYVHLHPKTQPLINQFIIKHGTLCF